MFSDCRLVSLPSHLGLSSNNKALSFSLALLTSFYQWSLVLRQQFMHNIRLMQAKSASIIFIDLNFGYMNTEVSMIYLQCRYSPYGTYIKSQQINGLPVYLNAIQDCLRIVASN